jgi:ketosteroid isomerase-like protein
MPDRPRWRDTARAMGEVEATQLVEAYEALNRGDDRPMVEFLDKEFRYRSREELPGGGDYEGREATVERLAELREMFVDIVVEPKDFIVSGEYVVISLAYGARGRSGGVRISQNVVHVWRVGAGKALELQVFSDKTQALEAVVLGLSE